MKNIVVVDIDRTVANIGERSKILEHHPIDWDAFYLSDFNDEPIREICDLVSSLSTSYRIVFLTGRRESVRGLTKCWLGKNVPVQSSEVLLMRPNNDCREDSEVKIEQFKKSGFNIEDVAFVLEDRNPMVKTWRDLGVKCLQVADGNF